MSIILRRMGYRCIPSRFVDLYASPRPNTHVVGGILAWGSSRASQARVGLSSSSSSPSTADQRLMYLHVGPSGECWTGDEIFAAKHLQPDYVKSLVIPPHVNPTRLLEVLESDLNTAHRVYDEASLPASLISAALADGSSSKRP